MLSTESTVSGMGLEVERLEDFIKEIGLTWHQVRESLTWHSLPASGRNAVTGCSPLRGYIQMEPGDRMSVTREQDRQDEHMPRHADSLQDTSAHSRSAHSEHIIHMRRYVTVLHLGPLMKEAEMLVCRRAGQAEFVYS